MYYLLKSPANINVLRVAPITVVPNAEIDHYLLLICIKK